MPEEDATVVKRLREAGAILLGKTNTPELTLHGETDNLIYGRTNNPYDLDRNPNGSSGGAAAIVSHPAECPLTWAATPEEASGPRPTSAA